MIDVSAAPTTSQRDYLLCSLGSKLTTLNVQHEVATTDILHDKVDPRLGLKTSMKVEQEWVAGLISDDEDISFRSCTLHFVVFDNKLFLQYFDSVQLLRGLGLCQHDLPEITLPQNSQEVEMVQADAPPGTLRSCINIDISSFDEHIDWTRLH